MSKEQSASAAPVGARRATFTCHLHAVPVPALHRVATTVLTRVPTRGRRYLRCHRPRAHVHQAVGRQARSSSFVLVVIRPNAERKDTM